MDIFKYKKFYVKLCIRLKVWWSIIAPQWNLDRAMVLFAAIDTKVEPKINVYTSAHYSGLHQPQSIYIKCHNTICEWLSFIFHFDKSWKFLRIFFSIFNT